MPAAGDGPRRRKTRPEEGVAGMVMVKLWSGLRSLADGSDVVEVAGATVGEVLEALARAHPGLREAIEEDVSVVVDGRIIASALNEPVSPDSEVVLMQRLRGG